MNKKAQEEIAGFVMIVVIVAIIAIILLAIFVRRGGVEEGLESVEIRQFLDSAMEYTSSCATNYEPDFSNLGDLILDCDIGRKCVGGTSSTCDNLEVENVKTQNSTVSCSETTEPERNACDVLNETLTEILNDAWPIGENRFYKGYTFEAVYGTNQSQRVILTLKEGDCRNSTRIIGNEHLSAVYSGSSVGSIVSTLKVCV